MSMSVVEARIHAAKELTRSADVKLAEARLSGFAEAEERYRAQLDAAESYCTELRRLALAAKLALPNGASQSYTLLKEALEVGMPEDANVG